MISLDQVLLLEEKVESAVQKIAQLNQENDALRTKCAELTKALSEKTEQLSSFITDQSKIEEGILKALERLNSVENSVLKTASLTRKIISEDPAAAVSPVQTQRQSAQQDGGKEIGMHETSERLPAEQEKTHSAPENRSANQVPQDKLFDLPSQETDKDQSMPTIGENGQFDIF